MQLDNRIIYNKVTGTILHQTGEAKGDVVPHEQEVELDFIDVPYGSINYSKQFALKVEGGEVIFEDFPVEETEEQKLIKQLEEDIRLLKLEDGGII
ncbi:MULTISPECIES: hypothetical protein [Lysinibacillus]|uniref:hypothetical protein n=1 Tax=Lysinibacillus TaxID=400634 RepID=UPI00257EC560|nr:MULTISPECIES: hypothetical protein [Lysinibacillus]